MKRAIAVAVGLASAATAAYAATVAFAVKPGLWEVNVRGQIIGSVLVPKAVTQNMSPEEKAQLEARVAASLQAAAAGHTFRNCVTAEQLRKGFVVDNRRSNTCTRTVMQSSAKQMIIRLECKERDHNTIGMVRFVANNAASVTGTTDMAVTTAGKTMMVHSTTTAKWLNADCGALKPGEVSTR